jgi:LuxR family transcriptional regulator, maltose regulon positive regulatory protein
LWELILLLGPFVQNRRIVVKLRGTVPTFMSAFYSNTLLHTKLMPPRLPSALVQRAGLLARLDQSLTKKVALVTAPTGFGKTTLVRAWIESRDFLSAWVTLDQHDNDPVRFWTYVCSALRGLDSSFGKATLSMLRKSLKASHQPSRHF